MCVGDGGVWAVFLGNMQFCWGVLCCVVTARKQSVAGKVCGGEHREKVGQGIFVVLPGRGSPGVFP